MASIVMARTGSPLRCREPLSLVLCKVCMDWHMVGWEPGWEQRMDAFVGEHYEEHGEYDFAIVVQ